MYNPQEKKLDPKTIRAYFVGYADRSKGYKFYCPSPSVRFVESRNAKFLENDVISGSDLSTLKNPLTSLRKVQWLLVIFLSLDMSCQLNLPSTRFSSC